MSIPFAFKKTILRHGSPKQFEQNFGTNNANFDSPGYLTISYTLMFAWFCLNSGPNFHTWAWRGLTLPRSCEPEPGAAAKCGFAMIDGAWRALAASSSARAPLGLTRSLTHGPKLFH